MQAKTLKRVQLGLSVVELLIALALGLLLMTGIIQVFIASRQTYATNEAMGRLQENGRFALDFIARNARNAGYVDPINIDKLPAPLSTSGCGAYCIGDNTDTNSDRITFSMQPVLQDGQRYSCTGDQVTPPQSLTPKPLSTTASMSLMAPSGAHGGKSGRPLKPRKRSSLALTAYVFSMASQQALTPIVLLVIYPPAM